MSRITVSPSAPTETRPLRLCGDADTSLQRGHGDEGYTLALFALLIIPIAIFVSFAVDLGAWYAQSSRLQRASDAAAMAGVVWLPNTNLALQAATNAAQANGYVSGGGTTFSTSVVGTTGYSAQISSPAPRYFSKIFASNGFNITRSATAQFNKPVPLGSPANLFGNDLPASCGPEWQPGGPNCGTQPALWAAIQGPYENHANGDPYATKCSNQSSGAGCDGLNADYRASGYTFAIDVSATDVNVPLTLQGWDMGQFTRTITPGSQNNDGTWPAGTAVPESAANQALRDCDRGVAPFNTSTYYRSGTMSSWWASGFGTGQCQVGDSGNKVLNFDVQLFDNDGSDLTISKTVPLTNCHYRLLTTNTAAYDATKNAWQPICTFTPTQAGIYPFSVRNSGLGADAANGMAAVPDVNTMVGYNAYSLKITGGSGATRLYAVDDMSIWTNTPGTQPRFYLAEIKPEHAGKRVQIDLYDPGDGSGPNAFNLSIRAPAAGAPNPVPTGGTVIPTPGVVTSCKYNAAPQPSRNALAGATLTAAANCTVQTKAAGSSTATYNNNWLRFEITIDPNYTCGTGAIPDCWWTVQYDFGSGGFPSDRTVWAINVVGDPVHLVQ